MIIKRKLYSVVIDKAVQYSVAAESMQQAIEIINKWRSNPNITSINIMNDCVLTIEDVQ